jgi:hypothetical protein
MDLVEFWSQLPLGQPPYVHPDDRAAIERAYPAWFLDENLDFRSYLKNPGFGPEDPRVHFSLVPAPYAGNLAAADIFVLLLNPGFSPGDYFVEFERPEFRARLHANLRQRLPSEFPNLHFDPEFCWTGAYMWWERKFRSIARALIHKRGGGYIDALRVLSSRVACIELFPYHSATFGGGKLVGKLPSSKEAQAYLHRELLPRARRNEVSVIVTRHLRAWSIDDEPDRQNIVRFTGAEARGAALGVRTRGGQEILRRLDFSQEEISRISLALPDTYP